MAGRKWILIVLSLYLGVLAVLTFLSNHILEKTVPHVDSCAVVSAYIDENYYDKAVPRTAICYSDQYGAYVFEVVRKKTPLGERCYLNRTSVNVLKTDIRSGITAISTSLSWGSEIIKENSSEFSDRDIVEAKRGET